MEQQICQKCVNFLISDTGIVFCDYDHFSNEKVENAVTFVPEMFDCDFWEELKND